MMDYCKIMVLSLFTAFAIMGCTSMETKSKDVKHASAGLKRSL